MVSFPAKPLIQSAPEVPVFVSSPAVRLVPRITGWMRILVEGGTAGSCPSTLELATAADPRLCAGARPNTKQPRQTRDQQRRAENIGRQKALIEPAAAPGREGERNGVPLTGADY